MDLVKLGKKGQVSIPRAVLTQLGLDDDQVLLVETTDDGAIVLRPTGMYPLELYDDDRIAEFLTEDEMPAEMAKRVAARRSPSRD